MAGEHVLGILPTGTGKSLCYQIPALSRYYKTGALTVVISPLVALMADQVAGLEAHGIGSCVDVERQFGLSARSRLTRREIHGVLRALRNLDRKKRMGGEVVATAGEILGEDEEKVFERDSATDDTRVRTAISWLEEAVLLTREENQVQVFPSSLRVDSVKEARSRLAKASVTGDYRQRLLRIAETLIDADPDEGISTDELMGASGLSAEGVRSALYDLEQLGIASNDTALTAFVHAGVERNSRKRL